MGDWRYDNGCQLEPQWPMTDATHPRLAYLSPSLPFSTPPSVVRRFSESFCGERAAFVKLLSYIEKRTGMYFQFCAKTSSSPSSSSFYSVNMKMALVRQHTDQYTYQSHSWMQQKFSCNNTNLSVQRAKFSECDNSWKEEWARYFADWTRFDKPPINYRQLYTESM